MRINNLEHVRRIEKIIEDMDARAKRILEEDLSQSQRAATFMLLKMDAMCIERMTSMLLLFEVRPTEGENMLAGTTNKET